MNDVERREFLRLLSVAFAAVAVGGCGGGEKTQSSAVAAAVPPAPPPAPVPAPPAPAPPAPAPAPASTSGILPAERTIDWTPGTIVGVRGGIPDRTTIFVNVRTVSPTSRYYCVGDGVHDDSDAIEAAFLDCPGGQVVYLPEGIYRINATLSIPEHPWVENISVRGDGPGRTILRSHLDGQVKLLTTPSASVESAPQAITAGATKGSTTVTMADTSFVHEGSVCLIRAEDDPPWMHVMQEAGHGLPEARRHLGWTFMVVAKTASTVTFEPPLPMDISAMAPSFVYRTRVTIGLGIEDLTFDLNNQSVQAFTGYNYWGCWFKNVEFTNYPSGKAFLLFNFSQGEIRRCTMHGGSAGSGGEGCDFGPNCCWNLIEDNIVYNGGGLVLSDSGGPCSGNVIAYNFLYNHSSFGICVADLDLGHGVQDTFNLVEGNVFSGLHGGDGYYGGASHNTIFRNWITATHPTATQNKVAVKLKHYNVYTNVVGNVLGTSDFPTSNNGVVDSGVATGGYYEAPPSSGYDNGTSSGVQVIYELGFPHIGNTYFSGTIGPTDPPDYRGEAGVNNEVATRDLNVKATLLRHGNYDYFSRTIVWDAAIAERTLPPSLLYAAKPAWFGALAWPPVDPAAPKGAFTAATAASVLPAAARFYAMPG